MDISFYIYRVVTDQIAFKPLFHHYMEEGFFILQYIGASGLIG